MKIETYKDRKGEFRFRIRSRNGRIVANSGEGYKKRSTMIRSINSMIRALKNGVKTLQKEIQK